MEVPADKTPKTEGVDDQFRSYRRVQEVPFQRESLKRLRGIVNYHNEIQVATHSRVSASARPEVAESQNLRMLAQLLLGPIAASSIYLLAIRPVEHR